MKKVGSSFKKLGGFFLILVLLFLLFSMFSGSKEGFYYRCHPGDRCAPDGDTCQVKDPDGNVRTNVCMKQGSEKLLFWRPQQA